MVPRVALLWCLPLLAAAGLAAGQAQGPEPAAPARPDGAPREVVSGRYHVVTDLPGDTGTAAALRLGRALSSFEEAYRALWKESLTLREPPASVRVQVFSRTGALASLMKRAGIAAPSFETGGIYLPEQRILAVETVSQLERSRVAALIHETVHFLNHELIDGGPMSPWFNEGLAQYCEYSSFDEGRFHLGAIDPGSELRIPDGEGEIIHQFTPARSLSYLRGQFMRNRSLSLGPMLEMREPREFYGEGAQLRYAQSWTLVHMLAHGSTRDARPLRPSFERYAGLEQAGRGGKAPLLETLGLSLVELDEAWYRHLDSLW